MLNARVIKVFCSSSCAFAEPVAGLALAERFTAAQRAMFAREAAQSGQHEK